MLMRCGLRCRGMRQFGRHYKRRGFPLFQRQRPGGTIADTGTKAVAITFFYELRLAVDQRQRTLFTVNNTLTATITLLFVYLDNRPR